MNIMTIEVRQMLIKSTVLPDGAAEKEAGDRTVDIDEIMAQIREECRQLVIDILRRERER